MKNSNAEVCSKAAVSKASETQPAELTGMTLFMQGVATSIDALSTGFTISSYDAEAAIVCSSIIATVTWIYVLYRHAYRCEGRRIVFRSC